MEIQISPLVLILSCCRVGGRSIAARSLAVARLRTPSPRHHVTGRQRRLPPLLATAGSFARRPSVAAPFVLHCPSDACKANSDGYRRTLAPGKV
jgi:hypothetical protein